MSLFWSLSSPSPSYYWGGTWNPADKNAAITLSNGNLTVRGTSYGVEGVRGTGGWDASGKHAFEATIDTTLTYDEFVGIAAIGDSLADSYTTAAHLVAYYPTSFNYYHSGYVSASGSTGVTAGIGTVLGIVLDGGALKIYIDGVLKFTPVTGLSGTFYPYAGNSPGKGITAKFVALTHTY